MVIGQYLKDLKKKKAMIIIGEFTDQLGWQVMCEAYHQGMTASQGYVWFLPPNPNLDANLAKTDNCTAQQLAEVTVR